MKAVGTKVIVAQDQSELVTEGGIALPETSQTKLPRGVVVAVGPEVSGAEINTVGVGDRVLFNAYAGTPITVSGKDYLVIDREDVLVVLGEGE